MNEKGLSQLPSPVKIFIISYLLLVAVGLLLSLWVVLKSPVMNNRAQTTDPVKAMREAGMPETEIAAAKDAQFYSYLKLAHTHHLGHVFIVFGLAGIYAFTRGKKNVRNQVIIWTTIATLIHTLGFLIYSTLILVVFGIMYGALLGYMMIVIAIDCFKPFREQ